MSLTRSFRKGILYQYCINAHPREHLESSESHTRCGAVSK